MFVGKLTMSRLVIAATPSVREFFRDAVDSALEHQALCPSEATAAYLVELLCDYARVEEDPFAQPLACVVAAAAGVPPDQSIQQLKQVGDHSLVVAGYFGDSLERLRLDVDYFVAVGGTAYRKLSRLLRMPSGETRLVVAFSELGAEFIRFVHVLSDVKRSSN